MMGIQVGRRIFSWCLIVQLPLFHRFNVYGCEIAKCGTLVRLWGSWDECHVGRIYKKVFFSGFPYFSLFCLAYRMTSDGA